MHDNFMDVLNFSFKCSAVEEFFLKVLNNYVKYLRKIYVLTSVLTSFVEIIFYLQF